MCLPEAEFKPFVLGEGNFIKQLVNFDKDNITDRVLKTIGQYCTQPDFHPEIIGRVSSAAKSLCMWVRAMEVQQSWSVTTVTTSEWCYAAPVIKYIYIYILYNILRQIPTKNYNGNYIAISTSGLFKAL